MLTIEREYDMNLHGDCRYANKISGYIYDNSELECELLEAFDEKDESYAYEDGDTYEEFKARSLDECFKIVEFCDIKGSMPILIKVNLSSDLLDFSDDIEQSIIEKYECAEVEFIKMRDEENHCSIADISYCNNDDCNTQTFEAHAHEDITRIMSDIIN